MSDLILRRNILDELEFEPSIDAANIGVAVNGGIVSLTGHVGSYAERVAAESVVRRVKGVRGIVQEIEVRYPSAKQTHDDQIAERALKIISWDTTIPADRVVVKVQKGWVTLSGEVEWNFQRTSAENSVRKLSGVVGVTNSITVRPRAKVSDVKQRIENALQRDAELESKSIRVSVLDGKVILEGNVHAWHERAVAERAAWAAPGVVSVDDRLRVSI